MKPYRHVIVYEALALRFDRRHAEVEDVIRVCVQNQLYRKALRNVLEFSCASGRDLPPVALQDVSTQQAKWHRCADSARPVLDKLDQSQRALSSHRPT